MFEILANKHAIDSGVGRFALPMRPNNQVAVGAGGDTRCRLGGSRGDYHWFIDAKLRADEWIDGQWVIGL